MSRLFFVFLFFVFDTAIAQQRKDCFINLTEPLKADNVSSTSQRFIIGSTCPSCTLTLNGNPVKTWPTGAFAYELKLAEGDTVISLKSSCAKGKEAIKTIKYSYKKPIPEKPTTTFSIERVSTFPEGDLWVLPGDVVECKVKALSNCKATIQGKENLYEMPDTLFKGISGIYQGNFVFTANDTLEEEPLTIALTDSTGKPIVKKTKSLFTLMPIDHPIVAITKGRLAHLEYGLGDDRLGGAKIGYIDSLILLKVIGKVGSQYKVQLSPGRTAYIPDEHADLMPDGTFEPSSLTGKMRVYGDSINDYVILQLFKKLPYQSFQTTEPSCIVFDVFGATNNTNWIDQLESAKEIKKVTYEQIADQQFRVTITLRHQQHWGHSMYYSGNNLVVKVRRQPQKLNLKDLTIAIDAGHGGSNTGAVGPTGVTEKELSLLLSLKLKSMLEAEGAKVIMTRQTDTFFDNKQRILFYRDSCPDLLLSIHLNSAADPLRASGTSVFYRHDGFRPLSRFIYKRMLELELKEYGNNGSFNFMLNSPTEYPNALVETLFLSNPEEEMKILDDNYRKRIAEKITMGIKDFLNSCK